MQKQQKHRYYKLNCEKKEVSKIKIENDIITVYHLDRNNKNSIFPLSNWLLENGYSPNVVVAMATNFNKAYCPEFLRTKLKYLIREATDDMIINYQIDFSERFDEYLSVYSDNEINKFLLDFGKFIYECMYERIDKYYTTNQSIDEFYHDSMSVMINNLSKIDTIELTEKINDLVIKLGCPVDIIDNKSYWNNFIYSCLIMYIYIQSYYGNYETSINYQVVLSYVCKVVLDIKNDYTFFSNEIFYTPNNKSTVYNVESLELYMNVYLYEKYVNSNSSFWYYDYMIDILEEYRGYLINITKDKNKIKKIQEYTISDLIKSYIRKTKKY